MNGEIKLSSDIVISARKALYDTKEIDFSLNYHILSINFSFEKRFLFRKTVFANSVSEWFNICLKRGLMDVKFILPAYKNDKHLLGFANTSCCLIVCYWKNGRVSCFDSFWDFDFDKKGWKVFLTEKSQKNEIFHKLYFKNQTEEFKTALSDIGKFASDIGFPHFSEVFQNAFDALNSKETISDENIPKQLPDAFKSIYYAVYKADVFGAMGSWNDSPRYYAYQKGLDKEYNTLSDNLLVQLRYYLMLVCNECWKRN